MTAGSGTEEHASGSNPGAAKLDKRTLIERPLDSRARVVLFVAGVVAGGGLLLANASELQQGFLDLRVRGEAFTQHRKALEARRSEIDWRFQQGVAMLHIGQYDHAITALHRVLELAPEMPEAHVNMGFALLGQSRHKPAADFFRSAIDLRADQRNAYYGLALASEGMGERSAALGAMRTYVHLAPEGDRHRNKALAYLVEWEMGTDSGGGTSTSASSGDVAH